MPNARRCIFPLALTTTLLAAGLASCSGGDAEPGTGGDAAGAKPCVETADCTVTVRSSGGDDSKAIQTAFVEVGVGETVCFCPGDYDVRRELTVAPAQDVTVKGLGESREDVVFDFALQEVGSVGLFSAGSGVTFENFWVKNTPGNGVVADGGDDQVFRNIKVTWDAGSVTENGAYAIYPTHAHGVLVEDCEVVGAADAGIYVGQSTNIIVRNNDIHGNVAGIEAENSIGAEIYGNLAYDNTGGIFIPLLRNLEKKISQTTRVYDNDIYDNNRRNFGAEGTIITALPAGTGVFTMASDDFQIDGNSFRDNAGAAIVIIGHETMDVALGDTTPDPEADPYPERLYIFGNTYENNGTNPIGTLFALGNAVELPVENVIWDGIEAAEGTAEICLGESDQASFRNFRGFVNMSKVEEHLTDVGPHTCTHDLLAKIELDRE